MIWIVEASGSSVDRFATLKLKLVTELTGSDPLRLIVEMDSEAADLLRAMGGIISVLPARDDLYVDEATRNVWEVFGEGGSVRLLGYVPP